METLFVNLLKLVIAGLIAAGLMYFTAWVWWVCVLIGIVVVYGGWLILDGGDLA